MLCRGRRGCEVSPSVVSVLPVSRCRPVPSGEAIARVPVLGARVEIPSAVHVPQVPGLPQLDHFPAASAGHEFRRHVRSERSPEPPVARMRATAASETIAPEKKEVRPHDHLLRHRDCFRSPLRCPAPRSKESPQLNGLSDPEHPAAVVPHDALATHDLAWRAGVLPARSPTPANQPAPSAGALVGRDRPFRRPAQALGHGGHVHACHARRR